MEVKVIVGSNYGDEGKGLVSYALGRDAVIKNKQRVLSVLYNGGVQRAHTAANQIVHCAGTANLIGGDTYYHKMFIIDPIALWLTQSVVTIHPSCRVVLPCDVLANRKTELERGADKHGSCGMGIFACVKRNRENPMNSFFAKNIFMASWDRFKAYSEATKNIKTHYDVVYNIENFTRACEWVAKNCKCNYLENIIRDYDVLIYEGGQGLLLDQANTGDFPHLTPSSVGSYNIAKEINNMGADSIDVFYVSRSYMTRHGAGNMEHECQKENINPNIVDMTNVPNPWQDSLRYGFINADSFKRRINGDFSRYNNANMNVVFTQLNYTNGGIFVSDGNKTEISAPEDVAPDNAVIWLSDQKDIIEKV